MGIYFNIIQTEKLCGLWGIWIFVCKSISVLKTHKINACCMSPEYIFLDFKQLLLLSSKLQVVPCLVLQYTRTVLFSIIFQYRYASRAM